MRFAVALVIIAASHVIVGQSLAVPSSDESSKYYDDAVARFHAGDYSGARVQLLNVLKHDSKNHTARLLLGRAYLHLEDGEAAEREIRQAKQDGADSSLILNPLVRALYAQGKTKELIQEIAVSPHKEDLDAEANHYRGQAYLLLGKKDLALDAYEEALKLEPDYYPPLLPAARVYLSSGQVNPAKEVVKRAVSLSPGDTEAWFLKGEVARLEKKYTDSVEFFSNSLEIDENNIGARLKRAASYIDLDRPEEALDDLDYVDAEMPKYVPARYVRALALARNNEISAARSVIDELASDIGKIETDDVVDPWFLYVAGAIRFAQKKYDLAKDILSRYRTLNPRDSNAAVLLAETLLHNREPSEALKVIRSIPREDRDRARIYALRGAARSQLGESMIATRMFERAAEAEPDQAGYRAQLALNQIATGRSAEAMESLRSAVEDNEGGIGTAVFLGFLHLKRGEFKEALDIAEGLQSSSPDEPSAFNLAGAAQYSLGDATAARESFERALEIDQGFRLAAANLASIDLEEGKIEAAESRYMAMLKSNSRDSMALMGLADIAESQQELDDAIDWLEKIRDGGEIRPQIRLMKLYARADEFGDAMELAEELSTRYPKEFRILEGKG